MPLDITAEERQALLDLIARSPLERGVLYDGLECSWNVRLENSRAGGLLIQALHRNGESWDDIAAELTERLGRRVAPSTVRGWIEPPAKERP